MPEGKNALFNLVKLCYYCIVITACYCNLRPCRAILYDE